MTVTKNHTEQLGETRETREKQGPTLSRLDLVALVAWPSWCFRVEIIVIIVVYLFYLLYNGSVMADEKLAFHSPSKGLLDQKQVIREITAYVQEMPKESYTLIIGTDSKGYIGEIDFISAIVLHRKGAGGRYFWQKTRALQVFNLRDKIYKETTLSLQLAEIIVPEIRTHLAPDDYHYKLEIHVDVGEFGPTRETIREVVGMVNGSGYACKTKPEAYGAFVVADKYTSLARGTKRKAQSNNVTQASSFPKAKRGY